MRQLLAHLPNRTRILFRGDSGFFVGDLPDFLDEGGHGYLSLTTCCAGWPFVVVTQYCAVGNRPPCAPILSEWQENGRVALVNKN